jgi:hypothetical protein
MDSKRTLLAGPKLADYLRSLPAEQLQTIELITNPPVSYGAQGGAGAHTPARPRSLAWPACQLIPWPTRQQHYLQLFPSALVQRTLSTRHTLAALTYRFSNSKMAAGAEEELRRVAGQ